MTTDVQNYTSLIESKLHILLALFKISEWLENVQTQSLNIFPQFCHLWTADKVCLPVFPTGKNHMGLNLKNAEPLLMSPNIFLSASMDRLAMSFMTIFNLFFICQALEKVSKY
jgi:hypothetical protein